MRAPPGSTPPPDGIVILWCARTSRRANPYRVGRAGEDAARPAHRIHRCPREHAAVDSLAGPAASRNARQVRLTPWMLRTRLSCASTRLRASVGSVAIGINRRRRNRRIPRGASQRETVGEKHGADARAPAPPPQAAHRSSAGPSKADARAAATQSRPRVHRRTAATAQRLQGKDSSQQHGRRASTEFSNGTASTPTKYSAPPSISVSPPHQKPPEPEPEPRSAAAARTTSSRACCRCSRRRRAAPSRHHAAAAAAQSFSPWPADMQPPAADGTAADARAKPSRSCGGGRSTGGGGGEGPRGAPQKDEERRRQSITGAQVGVLGSTSRIETSAASPSPRSIGRSATMNSGCRRRRRRRAPPRRRRRRRSPRRRSCRRGGVRTLRPPGRRRRRRAWRAARACAAAGARGKGRARRRNDGPPRGCGERGGPVGAADEPSRRHRRSARLVWQQADAAAAEAVAAAAVEAAKHHFTNLRR